ncbi:GPP34 family phosphoprotein [Phytohabitans aurantiacus]|uniref:GPP34 family phosphoprotein n=1 Tax=Phytohabitans aurantiacus TaxID=3016789 RepID=A0ABQ5R1P6_9ACTN|nr:GPP34 family phosphoprotein [Phytohabitans aurantiacus]GLH99869.1 hypothetical protein Pa4123_51450 [Phytohabitans aurantiacus]
MPSAVPTRLTDNLWLAAHDSVDGRPHIGDWPLAVGLATGLLAELGQYRYCELRQGELFRTNADLPDDPALAPLLTKMASEEQSRPPLPPPTARGRARASGAAEEIWGRLPAAQSGRVWPPQAQDEHRHRRQGHDLREWMSYLAYAKRAEDRVIARLSRTGLIRLDERRRLLGGTKVRYVPYDSVASGNPANAISAALQRNFALTTSELLLAGLFLVTGLHHYALSTLAPEERSLLTRQLGMGLDPMSRELLKAADAAVGEAAMR